MKKPRQARIVIEMPRLIHVAQGKFWFFLPVPFLYERFPFKAGEKILVTVTKYKRDKP